ncbi:MerR family transcriptional regulator [Xanthobacter aminoxidans]|uniref:MerR family transcriptional regulator n=1 Tax=Xanthobacter aminoxidans TaxID=186280 RepID=UPI003726DC71
MGPIGQPTITFATAVRAAGLTNRQLRGWVDKKQVHLHGDSERTDGQWRRFSPVDVARLALIGEIVKHGVGVVDAQRIVANTVDPAFLRLASFKSAPIETIAQSCRDMVLIVIVSDESADGHVFFVTDENALQEVFRDGSSFVWIHVATIVARALRRLLEPDAEEDAEASPPS